MDLKYARKYVCFTEYLEMALTLCLIEYRFLKSLGITKRVDDLTPLYISLTLNHDSINFVLSESLSNIFTPLLHFLLPL